MPILKKHAGTLESLVCLIEEIEGIHFMASEIDGHGDYERHFLNLCEAIERLRALAIEVPDTYAKQRDFAIYLMEVHNELSDKHGRLDFDSCGHWYTLEENCGKHLSNFYAAHSSSFLKYKSEFQYEIQLSTKESPLKIAPPSDPGALEYWDRETDEMELVYTQMHKHPEWQTAKTWKSTKIAEAISRATNGATRLDRHKISRYIARINDGEYEDRIRERSRRSK